MAFLLALGLLWMGLDLVQTAASCEDSCDAEAAYAAAPCEEPDSLSGESTHVDAAADSCPGDQDDCPCEDTCPTSCEKCACGVSGARMSLSHLVVELQPRRAPPARLTWPALNLSSLDARPRDGISARIFRPPRPLHG